MNEEQNTHISRIDAEWSKIKIHLGRGNGSAVRDHLQNVREDDKRIYNALYWRMDSWLASSFAATPLKASEANVGFTKLDVGSVRLSGYLYEQGIIKFGGDQVWWLTKNLPKIIAHCA